MTTDTPNIYRLRVVCKGTILGHVDYLGEEGLSAYMVEQYMWPAYYDFNDCAHTFFYHVDIDDEETAYKTLMKDPEIYKDIEPLECVIYEADVAASKDAYWQ